MFAPSVKRVPLLPYEKQLIATLGCTEEEYRKFTYEAARRAAIRPAAYDNVPEINAAFVAGGAAAAAFLGGGATKQQQQLLLQEISQSDLRLLLLAIFLHQSQQHHLKPLASKNAFCVDEKATVPYTPLRAPRTGRKLVCRLSL